MRRFDKKKNIEKVNLLTEQRYLKKIDEGFGDDVLSGIEDPSKPMFRKDLEGKPFTDKVGYSRLPNLPIVHALEFVAAGTFEAIGNARDLLKNMGYVIGSMEGGNPIGFSNKYNNISKWSNMTPDEHKLLDGAIISTDMREGGVLILFFNPPQY